MQSFSKECNTDSNITEVYDSSVIVEPISANNNTTITDTISFGTSHLEDIDVEVGSIVEITYNGEMMESYPAQITALNWKIAENPQNPE